MGRKRTIDKHLPRRVYQRRGKYYYAHPGGEWIPLGDDYGTALRKYGQVVGEARVGTLADLFDRYLVEIIPGKAERTQRDQTDQLELLRTAFGHAKPDELTPRDVIRYRNARGQKSQVQANQELSLLSHICSTAVEWEVLESNPCRDVKKFRIAPRSHYVEDADYRAMRAASPPRLRVLMDLALLTGQREGDLLALRWDQVGKGGIRFQQGKTGKVLVVGWSDHLRATIAAARALRPVGEAVVCTTEGAPYSTDGFQSLWRRARDRAKAQENGLRRPFRFHDLRAKSASDDALAVASLRLGHADTRITDRVYMRAPRKVKALDIGRRDLFGRRLRKSSKKKAAAK